MSNKPSNAFPTPSDRFSLTLTTTPDPGAYQPKHIFNQNYKSQYYSPGKTKFGKDTSTFMDQLWKTKEQKFTPAPGAY